MKEKTINQKWKKIKKVSSVLSILALFSLFLFLFLQIGALRDDVTSLKREVAKLSFNVLVITEHLHQESIR